MSRSFTGHESGEKLLIRTMEALGVGRPEEKAKKFLVYFDMIKEKRKWGSLVSTRSAREPTLLVAESLSILTVIPPGEALCVADIGSGGGVVGLALALACEKWRLFLVESSSRKAAFLLEVCGRLGLENVTVLNQRAERIAGEMVFDCVLSRAAGKLHSLTGVALGLLRPGGKYVAVKGTGAEQELAACRDSIERAGARVVFAGTPRIQGNYPVFSGVRLIVIEKL